MSSKLLGVGQMCVVKRLILSNGQKLAIYKIIHTSARLNIICEHVEQGAHSMI